MTTSDWIVLGVGVYASLVATTALIWNIVREKRKLVVRIGALWEDMEMFDVTITNKSQRGININNVGFILSGGVRYNLVIHELKIPKQITGEDSCTIYVKIAQVKGVLKALNQRIRLFCVEDGTGKLYKTRIPKLIMKLLNN